MLSSVTSMEELQAVLRQARNRLQLWIIWRHLAYRAALEETTGALSLVADTLIQAALDVIYGWQCERDGVPLEALRERGYYDVAMDYLNSLENSDLISPEFRKTLPFEKAQTLISSTDKMGDLNLVDSRLDQAQQLLDVYANNQQ